MLVDYEPSIAFFKVLLSPVLKRGSMSAAVFVEKLRNQTGFQDLKIEGIGAGAALRLAITPLSLGVMICFGLAAVHSSEPQ